MLVLSDEWKGEVSAMVPRYGQEPCIATYRQ